MGRDPPVTEQQKAVDPGMTKEKQDVVDFKDVVPAPIYLVTDGSFPFTL